MIHPTYTFKVNLLDYEAIVANLQPDENLENILNHLRTTTVWVDGVNRPLKHGDAFTLFGEVAMRVKNNYIDKIPQILELLEIPDVTGLVVENDGLTVTVSWDASDEFYTAVEYLVDGQWLEIIVGIDEESVSIEAEEEGSFPVRVRFTDLRSRKPLHRRCLVAKRVSEANETATKPFRVGDEGDGLKMG